MAELKTKATQASVDAFIESVGDATRHDDAKTLVALMRKATKQEPIMWGPAIIGFGSCVMSYDTGREMDWFPVGFSPRKANTVMYFTHGYSQLRDELAQLGKLGKKHDGKGCLYINKLSDIDLTVLATMVKKAMRKP